MKKKIDPVPLEAKIQPTFADEADEKLFVEFLMRMERAKSMLPHLRELVADKGIEIPEELRSPQSLFDMLEFIENTFHLTTATLYQVDTPIEQQLLVVQDISTELLAHLAKNPGLLYSIDPRKFEQLVATLLEKQGCMVSLTPRSADGGFDIMACLKSSLANLLFLVECKRYAPDNKVGVEIVRRIYGVTEMHRANCGLIITTSSFTRGALTESERVAPRVALKDYISLCEWLKSAVGDNA